MEAEWHAGAMMLLPSSLVDRLRNGIRVRTPGDRSDMGAVPHILRAAFREHRD